MPLNWVLVASKMQSLRHGFAKRTPRISPLLALRFKCRTAYHPDFITKDERDLKAGTGYGLDIVHTELTKVGGAISTSSRPGQGTTFKIIYPKALG
ncbi:ATP-binding protein [Coleofasciculus sp.]|uniref:ATP-binding protein n=1 Tax=Coleofasciculus sp. TaxID=3100458 RepID=UPI003A3CE9EE